MSPDRRRAILTAAAALALAARPRRARAAADPLDPEIVLRDPEAPVLANPDGDVTVVAYFDYRCPACRAGYPMLREEAARDAGVRLVLKDFPVFGPASLRAARLVLGAARAGWYEPALDALMRRPAGLDPAAALGEAGVDAEAARAACLADRARIDGLIARNVAQAEAFGFPGTPAYVIGFTLIPGGVERRTLREAIRRARG